MVKTQIQKYIILQAAIVLLTAVCSVFPDALFILAAVTVQIGLFAAVASLKPFWPSLFSPLLSYGVAFLLLGNWMLAFAAVLFLPAGALAAFCISKSCSRSKTVVISSVGFGASLALLCAAFILFIGGTTMDEISKAINSGIGYFADISVNNLPEAYFSQGLTKAAYRDLLVEFMRLFSMGALALACNAVAFFSTAVAKRVLSGMESALFKKERNWLYVLSKPSAVVFVLCYLCVLIGGDTLTLPQQIAFNTVIVALLGGVLVMAARSLKQRMVVTGISSLLIYVIVYFIFGMQVLLFIMSITGLIYAFKYKPQEDKDVCKK